MKNLFGFLILALLEVCFENVIGQQVVASAGGYSENETISLSWTLGEQVTESFQNNGIILTQGFQQPYNFYLQQILNIPAGWSGISSYVDPLNKSVEGIFAPCLSDFIILASLTQIYFPETGVNTIGNWNFETGYQVKASNDFELNLTGTKISNPSVDLSAGWNLIPVLSFCAIPVEETFGGFVGLTIVKQVAGTGIYWPEYSINTLFELVPGKAYFAYTTIPGTISFPSCNKKTSGTAYSQVTIPIIDPCYEKPISTPNSHLILFPAQENFGSSISVGSVIAGFTASGICSGIIQIESRGINYCMTLFGDDPITSVIEGMTEGETMAFQTFDPVTQKENILDVEFSEKLPNQGNFTTHGMSAVKHLNVAGNTDILNKNIRISIFPNPSHGIFEIRFHDIPLPIEWRITDVTGSLIKSGIIDANFSINLWNYPKGIYYLTFTSHQIQVVKKLVLN